MSLATLKWLLHCQKVQVASHLYPSLESQWNVACIHAPTCTTRTHSQTPSSSATHTFPLLPLPSPLTHLPPHTPSLPSPPPHPSPHTHLPSPTLPLTHPLTHTFPPPPSLCSNVKLSGAAVGQFVHILHLAGRLDPSQSAQLHTHLYSTMILLLKTLRSNKGTWLQL